MEIYKNLSGRSGIQAFEYIQDGIIIKFINGGVYEFTNYSAGSETISKMKFLARNGLSLNRFINSHSKNLFSRKIK